MAEEPGVHEHVEEGALRHQLSVLGLLFLRLFPQLLLQLGGDVVLANLLNEVAQKVHEKLASRFAKAVLLVVPRYQLSDVVLVGGAEICGCLDGVRAQRSTDSPKS